MVRRAALLCFALSGCPRVAVELAGRACVDGTCADGWVCHPETNICSPEITIGCDDPQAVCAWMTHTGGECSPVGAFLPCVDGFSDCRAGCRTCLQAHTWSACTDPDCVLGELWSCDRCDHDCRAAIAHAEPTCVAEVAPSVCGYVGACLGGWLDADGRRDNGCECFPAGDEVCNGVDDDCDGSIDDDVTCAGVATCDGGVCVPCTDDDPDHCGSSCLDCGDAAVCEGGTCVACTNDDPDHCGATCQVCAGESSSCIGGACACVEGTCNAGYWCDAGTCSACPDDDPDHCGEDCLACTGENEVCVGGSCQCSSTSCDLGRWCDSGSCSPCNTAEHCGTSCLPCAPTTPTCDGATCLCTAGSCAAGEYCSGGACVACSCPSLFPVCLDQGDASHVCRCSAESCGEGGSCEDADTACVFVDNFDGGSSLLHACSDGINNSWAQGSPAAGTCHSEPSCWATNPAGNYNNCELSCVESPALDASGVSGRIDVSFWARYRLEEGYDGVTPLFRDSSGWQLAPPTPDWDTATVRLGDSCSWTDVDWPAFGQYNTADAIGWLQIQFGFDSADDPSFFHGSFTWRIYLETDGSVTRAGAWVDDVEVRVTQTP